MRHSRGGCKTMQGPPKILILLRSTRGGKRNPWRGYPSMGDGAKPHAAHRAIYRWYIYGDNIPTPTQHVCLQYLLIKYNGGEEEATATNRTGKCKTQEWGGQRGCFPPAGFDSTGMISTIQNICATYRTQGSSRYIKKQLQLTYV